jgi:hypothetical protein
MGGCLSAPPAPAPAPAAAAAVPAAPKKDVAAPAVATKAAAAVEISGRTILVRQLWHQSARWGRCNAQLLTVCATAFARWAFLN